MSSIIKYRPLRSHANTFIWKLGKVHFPLATETFQMNKNSDIFQFSGYSCFLVFYIRSLSGEDLGCTFKLTLRGYPAPYVNNDSCDYSVFFKDQFGKIFATKSGEFFQEEEEEIIEFDFFVDDVSNNSFFQYSTICFSWAEVGCSKLLSQAIQTEAENETNQFLDEMSNDFRSFFESKTNTDCVLSVGKTNFPAHRFVLSARSTVLAAMLHRDTSGSRKGEVIIQDVDAGAFGHVLYFIYTGKVRGLSSDTAAPMYTVAGKYALISLRDKCLNYLLCNLSMENICDAALLAHVHAETELENKVVKFMKEKLQEMIETEKWKNFTDGHAELANKFLRSASMSN